MIPRGTVKTSIVYALGGSLYVNVTNECSNSCTFCIANEGPLFAGVRLSFESRTEEPTADEIMSAILSAPSFEELVFCGFGEPWERISVIMNVLQGLVLPADRVRINTNGQDFLLASPSRLDELVPFVETLSVSLNAPDAETYEKLCRPVHGAKAFDAVCDFIRTAHTRGFRVIATAVASSGVDMEAVRCVAEGLGAQFRAR